MTKGKTAFWFWAWLVLAAYKIEKRSKNPKCLVWKNLIIISGEDANEAYGKAMLIGQAGESKPGDCLKLDGKPGARKFLGIADMGLIHDPLEDGCELYFRESRSLLSDAKCAICSKGKIINALKRELSPYKKIKWNPHAK